MTTRTGRKTCAPDLEDYDPQSNNARAKMARGREVSRDRLLATLQGRWACSIGVIRNSRSGH